MLPKLVDSKDEFKKKLLMQSDISSSEWETMNDFCFLQLQQAPMPSKFAVPNYLISTTPSDQKAFIIGYPGYIEEDKFMEDYAGKKNSK